MKWKKLSALSLCFLLSGCSAMALMKAFSGGPPSVQAEAQVGDREAKVAGGNASSVGNIKLDKGSVAVDNSNKQSKVEQAGTVTINEGNNWLVIGLVLLAVIGWCMPTPAELFRKLKK